MESRAATSPSFSAAAIPFAVTYFLDWASTWLGIRHGAISEGNFLAAGFAQHGTTGLLVAKLLGLAALILWALFVWTFHDHRAQFRAAVSWTLRGGAYWFGLVTVWNVFLTINGAAPQ